MDDRDCRSSMSWMPTNCLLLYFFLLLTSSALGVNAWIDAEDLELYDVVEEVNQNFYDLLQINQTATTAEIKRSFRVLSLKLHPDRNKEPDADAKFRHLVAAAEVLKDEVKRKKYDNILVNGLPDWKSGIYYYRRVRKLSLFEISIIVSVILTFGHYLCVLAAFWEKNFEINEVLKKKQRKLSQQQIDEIRKEILDSIGVTTPRLLYDNLFVKVTKFCYHLVLYELPTLATFLYGITCEKLTVDKSKEETQKEVFVKTKKPKPKIVELPNFEDLYARIESKVLQHQSEERPQKCEERNSNVSYKNEWTESDLHLLIKLTKKFPGGIPQRWERIACALGRDIDEVTQRAKEMKSGALKCGNVKTEFEQIPNVESRSETMTDTHTDQTQNSGNNGSNNVIWSQEQQRLFEVALKKFPKGSDERWENIAFMVPGKSKEECIARFKSLVALVKNKRQQNG